MKKELVNTGPAPKGLPFSPGIRYGELVFVSGQGPFDQNGKMLDGEIRAQTKRTLENFQKVVTSAGTSMKNVLQTTVYLSNLDDFAGMNETYSTFFPEPRPARTTVRADLLFGMNVEIQGIAFAKN